MSTTSIVISTTMLVAYVAFLWNSSTEGGSYLQLPAYMDEIFHIPQAQVICIHDYVTWDHKITTFPGLYYLAYLLQQVLNKTLFHQTTEIICNESFLRMINVILGIGIFWMAYILRKQILSASTKTTFSDTIYIAWLIFLYPLNFLYYHVFYTDSASLFFFLCSHVFVQQVYRHTTDTSSGQMKEKKQKRSITISQHVVVLLLTSSCIFMRQTNVLWILFLLGITMLQLVVDNNAFHDNQTWSFTTLINFIGVLWQEKFYLLRQTWSVIVPILGFVAFVIHNKGIVLGDKENHQPAIHFAMLSHALLLYAIMASPRILLDTMDAIGDERKSSKAAFSSACWKVLERNALTSSGQVLFCASVLLLAALALIYGSLSHPFLLADNRHYTFYLWNRILKHFQYRVVIAPFYAIVVLIAVLDLSRSRGMMWMLILLIAMALSLLPTPLLEPRYFTQAVVTMLLHSPVVPVNATKQAAKISRHVMYLAQILMLMVFNGAILFIYFHKAFTWHDGSVARFMY